MSEDIVFKTIDKAQKAKKQKIKRRIARENRQDYLESLGDYGFDSRIVLEEEKYG